MALLGAVIPYPRTQSNLLSGCHEKIKSMLGKCRNIKLYGWIFSRNVDEWIYIDIADQHEDSIRFIKDCEKAIGKEIQILKSSEYRCVEDCVRTFGGFRNPANGFAPCTNWLKRE